MGNSADVKGRLLRELLTESNAFGFLVGSGGPGGEAGRPCCNPSKKYRVLTRNLVYATTSLQLLTCRKPAGLPIQRPQ